MLDLVQHLFLDLVQKDFQTVQVHGQAVQVHGQAAQVPGQTAQVPKQGRDLRRESAFCVAPVEQVSVLKWNLRHRGASGLFRNSPADVRTKNRQSSAVAMYVHR